MNAIKADITVNQEKITITCPWSNITSNEIIGNPDHPFIRPFDKYLETRSPPGKIKYILIQSEINNKPFQLVLFSMAITTAKRILIYPAWGNAPVYKITENGKDELMPLHHITIEKIDEKNLSAELHFTSNYTKNKIYMEKTKIPLQKNEYVLFLFTIIIEKPEVLDIAGKIEFKPEIIMRSNEIEKELKKALDEKHILTTLYSNEKWKKGRLILNFWISNEPLKDRDYPDPRFTPGALQKLIKIPDTPLIISIQNDFEKANQAFTLFTPKS